MQVPLPLTRPPSILSGHAVALSLRTSLPAHSGPHGGVSEAPFRQICRAMGADVVLSEFLSSEAIRRRIRTTLEGAEFEEVERPIGIQIYGADPNAMAEAARLITEHYRPEFIDINFGCPVKKVVQRNGGSGCLRDLELVDRIIRAVIGATHLPVTVKTRSGWNDESARSGDHRAPDAGRRCQGVHPARPHPYPDVLAARPTGTRSPGWSRRWTFRSSATATRRPRTTSSACGSTPGVPAP